MKNVIVYIFNTCIRNNKPPLLTFASPVTLPQHGPPVERCGWPSEPRNHFVGELTPVRASNGWIAPVEIQDKCVSQNRARNLLGVDLRSPGQSPTGTLSHLPVDLLLALRLRRVRRRHSWFTSTQGRSCGTEKATTASQQASAGDDSSAKRPSVAPNQCSLPSERGDHGANKPVGPQRLTPPTAESGFKGDRNVTLLASTSLSWCRHAALHGRLLQMPGEQQ